MPFDVSNVTTSRTSTRSYTKSSLSVCIILLVVLYVKPIDFLTRAEIDHVCACLYEGCWFRCRILKISSDLSTATVVNLDWGMVITVRIELSSIRRLPNEFCIEPVCSIMCQLDGVSNFRDFIPSNIIAQCNSLLSHSVYDVIVHDYHPMTGGKITLLINERNINEQIERLILPYVNYF